MPPTWPFIWPGPIRRVVSVKETFVRDRPLPDVGFRDPLRPRPSPGTRPGTVTNEDYVGALVEFANGARGTLEADRSIFGPQSSMAFELNGSKGAASWDHEKLNQLRSSIWPRNNPTTGSSRSWPATPFPRQGNIVPGGGNSLGYEDLKIIEALEYLTAVVEERRPFHPGFDDAFNGGLGSRCDDQILGQRGLGRCPSLNVER